MFNFRVFLRRRGQSLSLKKKTLVLWDSRLFAKHLFLCVFSRHERLQMNKLQQIKMFQEWQVCQCEKCSNCCTSVYLIHLICFVYALSSNWQDSRILSSGCHRSVAVQTALASIGFDVFHRNSPHRKRFNLLSFEYIPSLSFSRYISRPNHSLVLNAENLLIWWQVEG